MPPARCGRLRRADRPPLIRPNLLRGGSISPEQRSLQKISPTAGTLVVNDEDHDRLVLEGDFEGRSGFVPCFIVWRLIRLLTSGASVSSVTMSSSGPTSSFEQSSETRPCQVAEGKRTSTFLAAGVLAGHRHRGGGYSRQLRFRRGQSRLVARASFD